MPKTDDAPRTQTTTPIDASQILAANRSQFSAMAEANGAMMRRMADLTAEMARFASRRVQKDCETAKALAACRSPQDLADVYAEFMRTAAADYAGEMSELSGICAAAAAEALDAPDGMSVERPE